MPTALRNKNSKDRTDIQRQPEPPDLHTQHTDVVMYALKVVVVHVPALYDDEKAVAYM